MDVILSIFAALPGSISQGLVWGVMALGVYVTFKLLDFADLTVDSSICTGGAVSTMLIINGMNPLLSLVFSVLAGMLAGAATGLLHTKLGIPPILAGILTQLGLYSVNMRILDRANQSLLGQSTIISSGNLAMAIAIGLLFVLAAVGFMYWFFGTELGCAIRATGNNQNMVRAQGVNTDFTKLVALIISNGMVGLSGGLLAQYSGYADVQMGRGAIVIGLASVIIGEVVFGGKGNFALRLIAVAVGSILYYTVIAFVLQLGLNTNDLKLFSSLEVAAALATPYLKNKYKSRKQRKKLAAASKEG